jgi:hypothetical protein
VVSKVAVGIRAVLWLSPPSCPCLAACGCRAAVLLVAGRRAGRAGLLVLALVGVRAAVWPVGPRALSAPAWRAGSGPASLPLLRVRLPLVWPGLPCVPALRVRVSRSLPVLPGCVLPRLLRFGQACPGPDQGTRGREDAAARRDGNRSCCGNAAATVPASTLSPTLDANHDETLGQVERHHHRADLHHPETLDTARPVDIL